MKFKRVILFGYSPLFKDLADFNRSCGAETTVICGKRQENSALRLLADTPTRIITTERLSTELLTSIVSSDEHVLGLSFGSPFIFRQVHIDTLKGNLLNSHGAPLPEFKGGGGFSWRILQGDRRGASLMHFVTTKIDEGPIVFRKEFEFSKDDILPADFENRQRLEDKISLLPWLKSLIKGSVKLEALTSRAGRCQAIETYFPRLYTDFNAAISWNWCGEDIQKFIRAFSHPYSGAFTWCGKSKYRLFNCEIVRDAKNHPFTIGLITYKTRDRIEVATIDGYLSIRLSDIEGSIESLRLGDRFHTSQAVIDEIKAARVSYSAKGLVMQ